MPNIPQYACERCRVVFSARGIGPGTVYCEACTEAVRQETNQVVEAGNARGNAMTELRRQEAEHRAENADAPVCDDDALRAAYEARRNARRIREAENTPAPPLMTFANPRPGQEYPEEAAPPVRALGYLATPEEQAANLEAARQGNIAEQLVAPVPNTASQESILDKLRRPIFSDGTPRHVTVQVDDVRAHLAERMQKLLDNGAQPDREEFLKGHVRGLVLAFTRVFVVTTDEYDDLVSWFDAELAKKYLPPKSDSDLPLLPPL